jgi:peptide-methionine (S)-S-oxide reductase
MKKKIMSFFITVILVTWAPVLLAKNEVAVFAGGCFWSMQHDFDQVPGVIATTVGYTGGTVANPTYQQVSAGNTGHYEAIRVVYDPNKISYEKLVSYYWHDIDPSDFKGQFCDHGSEYKSMIFYHDKAQEKIAVESKKILIDSRQFNDVATLIVPEETFYPAEDYHQKYSEKNPSAYQNYRTGCGRDAHSKTIWQTN